MYFAFKDIKINYGTKTIIENLSMDVPKGKISTIIGPNGSGKSSLLRLISRKNPPAYGQVIYKDKSIYDYDTKELAKKIAFLPQIHKSPTDATVRTLVANGRFPYRSMLGGLSARDEEIIDQVIEFTGLSALEHRALRTLSGGERQRAWIAMTMATQAEILVLDEPTTYLDISYQIELMDLIERMKEEYGTTILLVLHDINLAIRYSDYLFALKDKNILFEGRREEVITRENIRDIFALDAEIIHHDGQMIMVPGRRKL